MSPTIPCLYHQFMNSPLFQAQGARPPPAGLAAHRPETVGRSKGVTVFLKPGQKVDESRDVSVQPVSLQRAFVALCGEEAAR